MAEGVLGIAGGGSAALSQEVIDKLKSAERVATVEPIEKRIEDWDTESAAMLTINALNLELIASFKAFSIDNETNAFEQKTATTSGTAVDYDVDDVSALIEGTTNITVTQLAQQSVYQTGIFSDKTAIISGTDSSDKLEITVGTADSNEVLSFDTDGKTYEAVAAEINANSKLTASVEQVSDDTYRLIIKSAESGLANGILSASETGIDLGFGDVQSSSISDFTELMGAGRITINGNIVVADTEFMSYDQLIDEINNYSGGGVYTATKVGDTIEIKADDGSNITVVEDGDNGLNFTDPTNVLAAQNLKASIDGVSYEVSSNTITTQGSLKITANELGDSSITIRQDTSGILTGAKDMIEKYNSMITLIDGELNSADSTIADKSSLRLIKSSMKDILFNSYGENADKNIFNFGFDLDKSGYLSINDTTFNKAVSSDLDSLKSLFIGTAENKGLGTLLYTYTDALDGYEGLLTQYDESMTSRKTTLEKELADEIESLDSKYALMAEQFAAYGSLIASMEAQFGSLQMMIDQSTSSN